MIETPLALAAVIAGCAALGLWCEQRFAWATAVGGSMIVILFGAVLSNLGLVAAASPVYDAVTGPVTSLALVWLLLAVDLRDLRVAGKPMLVAFGLAALATATGAFVATVVFAPALGDNAWRLAGPLTGTYIGGSVNFVALGRALELPEEVFAAATASDNLLTGVWMGVTLTLPLWLMRRRGGALAAPGGGAEPRAADATGEAAPGPAPGQPPGQPLGAAAPAPAWLGAVPLRAVDIARLLAVGFALLFLTRAVAERVPQVPQVLWLTTCALVAAQLPGLRRSPGAMQLGLLALNLFFVVIGIGSRVAEVARVGLEVFYCVALVVALHGLLLFGIGRLARLDVPITAVASQAAVGGPSTAMALAVARGWPHLVVPGLVAGLVGYAIGNYAGFAVAALVRQVTGY